ncbi:hypothetical protein UCRPC4_g05115 [Phaeomoniella chlamydospora]|uniref:SpvB domain-containing protein n=1 Tax=Phaeomoniella chlamydospora TaxID=158046 RepID=A0A0G2GMS4_PHACM|nr:hypothetical protein UCRPC4_g05115 [Phaeomoniella chlamydospora]
MAPIRQRHAGSSMKPQSGTAGPSSTTGLAHETGTDLNTSNLGVQSQYNTALSNQTAGPGGFPKLLASLSGSGGGSHRSIGETFKVNPQNGTMTLVLPVQVTPGRSEFEPHLDLSYDSGCGNGTFGIGWGVSMDSIARRTSKEVPQYNDSDAFIISGAEDLVRVKKSGIQNIGDYLVREYKPRVEVTALKIEQWLNVNDENDIYWRTINGDNMTTIYGRDDASRILDVDEHGRKRIFSWLISETFDSRGNIIRYTYKAENTEGAKHGNLSSVAHEQHRTSLSRGRMKHLKSVQYGNKTPNRDLKEWKPSYSDDFQFMFSVVLDYGDHDKIIPTTKEVTPWDLRKDPFSTYKPGFELRTYRLVRRILMFHHVPEKLGQEDYLVNSVNFEYAEHATGSFIESVQVCGHKANGMGGYHTQTRAPFTFEYSGTSSILNLPIHKIDSSNLVGLPVQNGPKREWVDLDQDGSPGLLVREDGAWHYQRNDLALLHDKDESFGPIRILANHPSQTAGGDFYFEDLDHKGALDVIYLDKDGRLDGYQQRVHEEWEDYRKFNAVPNMNISDPSVQRVDLTGNGLQDLLWATDDVNGLTWQKCLAKDGFTDQMRLTSPTLSSILLTGDEQDKLYLHDMSGDGLTDVVHVSNGKISYWPNLGHGKFGAEVIMSDCPRLDTVNQFTHARVRLVDVDGSGTTDLIYLTAGGGATVYYNQAGNGWSSGERLNSFPEINDLSSVFAIDLLGNGTTCLCWTRPSHEAGHSESLFYIDLMSGQKPHLLTKYSNGMGLSAAITYRPSTWFYLSDLYQGRTWKTKLSFPVQCIDRLHEVDEIASTTRTTRYTYHDGFYDTKEREFRGFGMVEQWDAEDYNASIVTPFTRPPIHTKMWFHTGSGDQASTPSLAFSPPELENSKLPDEVSVEERSDVFRALKGAELRTEIFSDDASKQADKPYSVVERRYTVLRIQASDETTPGIYRVNPMESLTSHYERNMEDPRQEHVLTLEVNSYGDVVKTATIAYGNEHSSLPEHEDQSKQKESIFFYTEKDYTNAVDDGTSFCKPLIAAERQYRILDYPLSGLAGFELIAKDSCQSIKIIPEIPIEAMDDTSAAPIGQVKLRKILTKESRNEYMDNLLSRALPNGCRESYSVLSRTFTLAMTSGLLHKAYGGDNEIGGQKIQNLMVLGGYSSLGPDGRWWSTSIKNMYGLQENSQLEVARSSFYTPTVSVDPFGNVSSVKYDEWYMLPLESIDAMENTISFDNDYVTLRPKQVTDSNGNRVQTAFDALGTPVGFAHLGKTKEEVGDSLDDFETHLSQRELDAFISDPVSKAPNLLGTAGSRKIRDIGRFWRTKTTETVPLPAFEATITRDKHFREEGAKLMIHIGYFDGKGELLQDVSLVEHGQQSSSWCIGGWAIRDNKGNPVKKYQPSIAESHKFVPQVNMKSPSTTIFLDSIERSVGISYADHTWTKEEIGSWSRRVFDTGDTILLDPSGDSVVGPSYKSNQLDVSGAPWYEQRMGNEKIIFGKWDVDAARKSESYNNTPTIVHYDALGRVILTITDSGKNNYSSRNVYDIFGNKVTEKDASNRLVQSSYFDFLGRPLHTAGMDYGDRWTFVDCQGQPILQWNSRGFRTRIVYDKLRRYVQMWLSSSTDPGEILINKLQYGETEDAEGASDRNQRGQVVRICDQSGMLCNTKFDFMGQCESSVQQFAKDYKSALDWNTNPPLEDDKNYTFTRFDALHRAIESTDARGGITKREFNLSGSLESVAWKSSRESQWVQIIRSIAYSADEKPTLVRYGNGVQTSYVYNNETRRLAQRSTHTAGGSKTLEKTTYTHDCLGQISHIEDEAHQSIYFDGDVVDASRDYVYDSIGQLIQAEGREQFDASNGGGNSNIYKPVQSFARSVSPGNGQSLRRYIETYQYDRTGNITEMKHAASGNSTVAVWAPIVSATLNMGQSKNGYSKLAWDWADQLRSSSTQIKNNGIPETTWYVYNVNGDRVRKVTERATATEEVPRKKEETIYLPAVDLHRTYHGDGQTLQFEKITSQVLGVSRIALIEDNLLRYQVNDSLELDDLGNVVSYEEYSPFGATTYVASGKQISAPRKYRYASYERDMETGLYHCGHRYYAPWLGRWISSDPIGTGDGLNLYRYVANDPVNFEDPTGTMRLTKTTNFHDRIAKIKTANRDSQRGYNASHNQEENDLENQNQKIDNSSAQLNPNVSMDQSDSSHVQVSESPRSDQSHELPVNESESFQREAPTKPLASIGRQAADPRNIGRPGQAQRWARQARASRTNPLKTMKNDNLRLGGRNKRLTEENTKLNAENLRLNKENSRLGKENSRLNRENKDLKHPTWKRTIGWKATALFLVGFRFIKPEVLTGFSTVADAIQVESAGYSLYKYLTAKDSTSATDVTNNTYVSNDTYNNYYYNDSASSRGL